MQNGRRTVSFVANTPYNDNTASGLIRGNGHKKEMRFCLYQTVKLNEERTHTKEQPDLTASNKPNGIFSVFLLVLKRVKLINNTSKADSSS